MGRGTGATTRGQSQRATIDQHWVRKWDVFSSSDPDKAYVVSQNAQGEFGCSCPQWKFRRQECKHIQWVIINRPLSREGLVMLNVSPPRTSNQTDVRTPDAMSTSLEWGLYLAEQYPRLSRLAPLIHELNLIGDENGFRELVMTIDGQTVIFAIPSGEFEIVQGVEVLTDLVQKYNIVGGSIVAEACRWAEKVTRSLGAI